MLSRSVCRLKPRKPPPPLQLHPTVRHRLFQMAAHLNQQAAATDTDGSSDGTTTTTANPDSLRLPLRRLPKSSTFPHSLPPDPAFPTPQSSHSAPRETLGPRQVKGALYTYVRPEPILAPELLATSPAALRDIGIAADDASSEDFRQTVAGNQILTWDEDANAPLGAEVGVDLEACGTGEDGQPRGVYPWAQCYGGYQFGSWAGQLGDGRAISLFETMHPGTGKKYELQLKGAGKTPYSRFADGKAVLRSSIREFVVSEYLNAIGIPTTRALSLTLAPRAKVVRERVEPGAVVCRFAESWVRLGTFDLLRARGERGLTRQLATFVAEQVLGGWEALPGRLPEGDLADTVDQAPRGVGAEEIQGEGKDAQNRFARLYREIARRNARTVAAWQAYGFMNGVLNTDNTSVMGLSMDYGPFAFMDAFDPAYTPNHDDHLLRYSYRAQPSVIWWNLVRLGEALGELIGAGERVDDPAFVNDGVTEAEAPDLVARAEHLIMAAGEEYKAAFMREYRRLMTQRLGLRRYRDGDFEALYSEWLDLMEAFELDFHHCFRRLSDVRLAELRTEEARMDVAGRFFSQAERAKIDDAARKRIAAWLKLWAERVREDWGEEVEEEEQRVQAMRGVNPNFVPRSWILDELIERVERRGEREEVLGPVMRMVLAPFEDGWEGVGGEGEVGVDPQLAARWCGDVPRYRGLMQCSCSS